MKPINRKEQEIANHSTCIFQDTMAEVLGIGSGNLPSRTIGSWWLVVRKKLYRLQKISVLHVAVHFDSSPLFPCRKSHLFNLHSQNVH